MANSLSILGLGDDLEKNLGDARVYNLDHLLWRSEQDLVDAKISKANINKVTAALKQRGLSLRGAPSVDAPAPKGE